MENKDIAESLALTADMLELHGENEFKVKSYRNAAVQVERMTKDISAFAKENQLEKIPGIGKTIASHISEMLTTGNFLLLEELLDCTPMGVIEMMQIRGIGPKKIRMLWKEHRIISPQQLLKACNENKIAGIKGFGEKTQGTIKSAAEFLIRNKNKFLFSACYEEMNPLLEELRKEKFIEHISFTGDMRRNLEIIQTIEILVATQEPEKLMKRIAELPLTKDEENSTPLCWRGKTLTGIPVEISVTPTENYFWKLFITTGNKEHIKPLLQKAPKNAKSEEEIYKASGFPKIPCALRENMFEWDWVKNGTPKLLEEKDLKGILHCHSTWSDGASTLEEMATVCKNLGYEYIGISDHSKSSYYANGLKVERIENYHREIDALNKKLSPFRIFKGIECDILNDGSLDYEDSVLKKFEFVIVSIHQNLKMDEEKATARLIRTIENPHTTILGHLTGRLLLGREGYPINYKKVIDACAENGVIIEFNANPKRWELDWRWIPYALSKNILISINPDAHRTDGFQHLFYGVMMSRKGMLTKEMTFNTRSREEATEYFSSRKKKAISEK